MAYSQEHGGWFTTEDFDRCQARWVEPISATYGDFELWELPPAGQGLAAIQMLNIFEARGNGLRRDSADWWHLAVEAKKLAFEDRARYYADREFRAARAMPNDTTKGTTRSNRPAEAPNRPSCLQA